jgi:glycerophosphoryl diester phosphodiesterase
MRCACMQVHAYTFSNENAYLPWTWGQDPFAEMHAFLEEERVDGLFTDFPDAATAYRERVSLRGLGGDSTIKFPIRGGAPMRFQC